MSTQQEVQPIFMPVSCWMLFWLCVSLFLDYWIVKGLMSVWAML